MKYFQLSGSDVRRARNILERCERAIGLKKSTVSYCQRLGSTGEMGFSDDESANRFESILKFAGIPYKKTDKRQLKPLPY